jgi:glycosyltransferase involved in cell wall biosynthesis
VAENSLNSPPLISVCIPLYNSEKYVAETIQSVLDQTYKNIEIILVDDGSTDASLKIADQYAADGVRVIAQKNKGASAARNEAFRHAKGAFIKFLDADDLMNEVMIARQVELAVLNPECVISASWGRFYTEDPTNFVLSNAPCYPDLPGPVWLSRAWVKGDAMMQPGIFLIPAALIHRAGPWDESLSLIDDLDFFTRTILVSEKVIKAGEAVLYYRSGLTGSLSGRKSATAVDSAFRSIDKATKCLFAVDNGPEAKLACANVWQNFIYDIYPDHADFTQRAEDRVKNYQGSDLAFPCGGWTRVLRFLLGWRRTRRLKKLIR